MKIIVTYEKTESDWGQYELDHTGSAKLVITDNWLSIVSGMSEHVYFVCPREHVISARNR